MRIFIERFLLTILASLVVLLVAVNPVAFTWRVRIICIICLIVAAAIAAYFAGASEYRWERLKTVWWFWLICGVSIGITVAFWINPFPLKSSFLALDDGQKWRFSESLRKAAVAENGERISCEFALGLSYNNQFEFEFVWGVWTELQSMLDLSWWRHTTSGDLGLGQRQFPPGFTILAGADKGPGFICAAALGRALQDTLAPGTPVTVHTNQVTEALSGCKNNCVELDIGDFRASATTR